MFVIHTIAAQFWLHESDVTFVLNRADTAELELSFGHSSPQKTARAAFDGRRNPLDSQRSPEKRQP